MKRSKPFAITLDPGSSLANHTGSWRTVRPEYVDRLPPCNHACPAGENIQGWLFHAEAGNYEQAWRVLTRDNPLPADTGLDALVRRDSALSSALMVSHLRGAMSYWSEILEPVTEG